MSLLSITVVTAVSVLQLPASSTAVTVIQLSTLIHDNGLLRSNSQVQVNSAATVALVKPPDITLGIPGSTTVEHTSWR